MSPFMTKLRTLLGFPRKTIDDALAQFNKALNDLREREQEHLKEAEAHAVAIEASMKSHAAATAQALRASGIAQKFADLIA